MVAQLFVSVLSDSVEYQRVMPSTSNIKEKNAFSFTNLLPQQNQIIFTFFPFKIKSSRVDKSSKLRLTNQFVFEDGQLLARVHKSSKLLLVN